MARRTVLSDTAAQTQTYMLSFSMMPPVDFVKSRSSRRTGWHDNENYYHSIAWRLQEAAMAGGLFAVNGRRHPGLDTGPSRDAPVIESPSLGRRAAHRASSVQLLHREYEALALPDILERDAGVRAYFSTALGFRLLRDLPNMSK
jgi:hypothetical protein